LIVPSGLLVWVITSEANSIAPTLKQWGSTVEDLRQGKSVESIGGMRNAREWLGEKFGVQPAQFRRQVISMADAVVRSISNGGTELMKYSMHFLSGLV